MTVNIEYEAEKALGIRNMLEHFGMKPNQAVVFGDGYNDLSMFRPEWLNIAMGNARPELKAKAEFDRFNQTTLF